MAACHFNVFKRIRTTLEIQCERRLQSFADALSVSGALLSADLKHVLLPANLSLGLSNDGLEVKWQVRWCWMRCFMSKASGRSGWCRQHGGQVNIATHIK